MKHIVSFSGGKDSTLMLLLMLEKGMPIDDIIFADTGMEFQELYDYVERIEGVIGRKVTRLKSDKTWDDVFFHKRGSGKNIGQIVAFPPVGKCEVARDTKMRAIRKYYRSIGGGTPSILALLTTNLTDTQDSKKTNAHHYTIGA